MGTISVNRLGGMALIIGPIVAVVSFLIRPGGGLVAGTVDPADAAASIGVLIANSGLATISNAVAPLGLIVLIYGINVMIESNLRGGNGEAIGRLGVLFASYGLVAWIIGSSCALVIAGGNAATAVGALYATGLGLNIAGGVLFGLAFVLIGLAASSNENFNRTFALVIVALSMVSTVLSIWTALDNSMLQTGGMIVGPIYGITTIWSVTVGRKLMNKG